MNTTTSHCRLCAECKPYIKLVDLSDDDDKRSEITTKIARLDSPVCDVFANNYLPKTVCLVCIDTLNNSYDFIQNIETAQKALNEIYKEEPVINSENTSMESIIEIPPLELDPLKELHLVDELENGIELEEVDKNETVSVETSKIMTWKEYSWACSQCDTIFPTLDELQTHTIGIHGICNRYKCTLCNSYQNRQNLDRLIVHLRNHKKDLKYSCYKCHLQFDTQPMCSKHILEHKKLELSCPGCNYNFNNIEDLNEHKAKYFKGVSYKLSLSQIPTSKSLTCQVCNLTLKSKQSHLQHFSRCLGVSKNEFMCDYCGKFFSTKNILLQHSIVHTDMRLYKCEKCLLNFKTPKSLKCHRYVHMEVKPYPCSDCDKSFRQKYDLKIHRAMHTEEKHHKCEYCNKEFRWKNSLVQHVRQHTGEKPYTCEKCSRKFTCWPNYQKHIKGVHGINKLTKKNKQSQ